MNTINLYFLIITSFFLLIPILMFIYMYMKHAHFKKFKSSLTIGTILYRTHQKDDFSQALTERWTITDIGPNQVKLVDEHGWWTVWNIKDIYENTEWSFVFK